MSVEDPTETKPQPSVTRPANDTVAELTAACDAELMAQYGIVRVPVDYFHVGDFRYTSLREAIAQAKKLRAVPAAGAASRP